MTDYSVAIVRNVQTNDFYKYLGNNKYRNLRTLKEGIIEPDIAKKVFNINMEMTILISNNPCIEKMINVLSLKFCNH